jgi:hypothetical protein
MSGDLTDDGKNQQQARIARKYRGRENSAGRTRTYANSALALPAGACGTQKDAHAPDLQRVIAAWDQLSPELRTAVLAIVGTAAKGEPL